MVCRYIPGAPLVTVQIRVMSGLSNEGEYAGSGISHFLEHLLFKGTDDRTSGDIRREIKKMGGVANASTGLDSAEYHIIVSNENFEKALDLLIDMVMAPVFTDEEMEVERDVVLKEIRLHNDDPISKRTRLLFSEAYRKHVYKYPIIGREEAFRQLSREDILRYHSAVYTPDRIVIGIAGGVSPPVAFEAAERKFGKYQSKSPRAMSTHGGLCQPDVPPEPEQVHEIKSEFHSDVILGYLAIGFHTTSLYSPELYAGDVLNILLGEGNDSRLYKRLVKDKQLLYAVSSLNYTPKYPGLFIITGIGEPEKLQQARQEIFDVIDELKKDGVRDSEIERARNLVMADYFRSHERVKSIASSMTHSQILTGDPAFFEKYIDEVKKVRKEEVIKIASKYLCRDNSTTVFLLPGDYCPQKAENEDKRPEEPEIQQMRDEREGMRDRGRGMTEAGREPVKDTGCRAGQMTATAEETKEDVKFVTLGNGLRVVVKRRPRLPIVSVTFAVPGGLRTEDSRNNGISNLTASVLLKGTTKRDESEIIPALERKGANIGTFSGMNSMGVFMDLLADDMDEGLDILEDVVKNAVFPEEEIAKQKKKIIASIKEQENDIFENGMIQLRGLLYGDHPYAMNPLGRLRTVKAISREQIMDFYRKQFDLKNAVIAVVGDVDTEKTVDALAKRFGDRRGPLRISGGRTKKAGEKVVPLKGRREEDIVMRKEQSLLLIGFQGVRLKDRKKYALAVISSLLSGADGLLFYAIREKAGLAYASGAVSVPQVDPGYFVLYAATTEENIEKARDTMRYVLGRLTDGDISEEEIESCKNWLIFQHAYSLETNHSICMTMALDELYGLGFRHHERYAAEIAALTRDEIIQCGKEILDPDKWALVVIHSAERE